MQREKKLINVVQTCLLHFFLSLNVNVSKLFYTQNIVLSGSNIDHEHVRFLLEKHNFSLSGCCPS